MYHNAFPWKENTVCLHKVHDCSCGAAGQALEVDITARVGAQRYVIYVRPVAGPLKSYGHVSHVHTTTKGAAGGRQRTLTLSVILRYMSGAMSCNMYGRLLDRDAAPGTVVHIRDVSPVSHAWPDARRPASTLGTVVRRIRCHWLARGHKGLLAEAAAGAERAPSAIAAIVEQRRRVLAIHQGRVIVRIGVWSSGGRWDSG